MIAETRKAIYVKLNGASGVTTLLSSATAIYARQAPVGATMPYIVYTYAGGGEDNITPTPSGDMLWYIKAVAQDQTTSEAIAAAMRTALHEQDLTLENGWTAYRCQAMDIIDMVENVDKVQYYHIGNAYRIRVTQ